MKRASIVLAFVLLAGCQATDGSAPGESTAEGKVAKYPYRVVTTCAMVTDIVRMVAGEHAEVTGLMGEGVDPHMYKPTRNDVRQLLEADVVFYSGLMLEGRMADAFARVGRGGKPVFAVTEEIDRAFLLEPPEFEGHWDPHVWMDVTAWSECVAFVAKALGEFDPQHQSDYAANAPAYRERLAELHGYVKQVVGSIPESQRVLITAHDAFGYFARAYGIQVRSVQGLSTESSPSIQDVNELVQFIVERDIRALFVESSVSRKNIEAIMDGVRQKGGEVRIGGELFSDAMGAPGTYEGTYVGMIDHNATVIARALGGEAPRGGWQGKLTHEKRE